MNLEECKYCFKSIENGSTLLDLMVNHDVLCPHCRRQFLYSKKKFYLDKVRVNYFYVYNDFFSSLLVQYKECMDEALHDVFIYTKRLWIWIRFHHYTIVPLPSSEEKLKERGFHHVEKMFEGVRIPQCDCLEKIGNQKQAFLSKMERQKMSFQIGCKEDIVIPKRILLVDDVLTTGNTMKGAIHALSHKKCKIKILVVAIHPLNLK